VDIRARPALDGPGTPDGTGACSSGTGADGLPFRVRPPSRPDSSDIAMHDPVILSDHDLAVIREAVALARQDGHEDDRQNAAAAQYGPGLGPGPHAEQSRASRPPEPRGPAPPPAATPALPAASPTPAWGTVLANTIRLWARRRFWPATPRRRVINALILAAVLFGGGAVIFALTRGTTAGNGAAGSARPAGAPGRDRRLRPADVRGAAEQGHPSK
jgi:hypothetical protein